MAEQRQVSRIKVVTAASLFDGHDVAINIVRRILQAVGCEVIHLGHNRSVEEIVRCAIQEDAQAIAVTSYQGGHLEFFRYMVDLLRERGGERVKVFGGGGGVILPDEIRQLHDYGVCRIYSPDDGRVMGFRGMVEDMLGRCEVPVDPVAYGGFCVDDRSVACLISAVENGDLAVREEIEKIRTMAEGAVVPVVGVTGTGGAGKSSLCDELVQRFLRDFEGKRVALISVDPSRRKTGGALLGDRIRVNSASHERVFMRSFAVRDAGGPVPGGLRDVIALFKSAGFDLILLETAGIGQGDTAVTDYCDISMYVMTPEYGAESQLEKINMLDYADFIVLNKFDKVGAGDALREVRKQVQRNREEFDRAPESFPVYGTIASHFNHHGVNCLYRDLLKTISAFTGEELHERVGLSSGPMEPAGIIPVGRSRYLTGIVERIRAYDTWAEAQAKTADRLFGIWAAMEALETGCTAGNGEIFSELEKMYRDVRSRLDDHARAILEAWPEKVIRYGRPVFEYAVRGETIRIDTAARSLAGLAVRKVALPRYKGWGDILRWNLQENVPGEFPYTAGVFPFKREGEDPTRMFAGEGGPERTNRRFHYLAGAQHSNRLSTAFDSVTLYGENPGERPDIYGKIGNAGVSVCCLDDMKILYSGFNLMASDTSVSMTINGPAPVITGFFMNTAIDQQCEIYIRQNSLEKNVRSFIADFYTAKGQSPPEYQGSLPDGHNGLGLMLLGVTGDQVLPAEVYEKIRADALSKVRGTVQADILKEDQAQNTCIFSMDFALRMMGDMQQYFIGHRVRNFYSVSVSGYHIAEAGANPITQLAFTLANGFTYVEYYLSRGMKINDFAPNLSFFFSNGIEPEYAVIGRVARRIWAKAIRGVYKGDERSQKLKYHIQTSGRSLHAQDIDFNDIRTTLQALYAIYDNCNSLHTNACDEAVSTPTEASVRRALAIQLIINAELGLARNQNPLQGSFIIEELTDLVEEAVLREFERISERGGVLGAMETRYQRRKIQDESMHYESMKQTGEYPVIGVNRFISSASSPFVGRENVTRATEEEKRRQVETVERLHARNREQAAAALKQLQSAAANMENTFGAILGASRYCSLGQICSALYLAGGKYRRNM